MNKVNINYSATPNDIVRLFNLTMPRKRTDAMEDMLTFFYDNAGRTSMKLKYSAINICYNDYCKTSRKTFFNTLTASELHYVISGRLKRYMTKQNINFIAFPELGDQTRRYHMHGIAIFTCNEQIHDYKVWIQNTFLTTTHFKDYEAVKQCDDPSHWFGYIIKQQDDITLKCVGNSTFVERRR